jgi:hypothetical protein
MNPDRQALDPDGPPLAELIGRQCGINALEWHLERLETSQGDRRRYHARWLAHLIAPADARYLPLVSVIIPVFKNS